MHAPLCCVPTIHLLRKIQLKSLHAAGLEMYKPPVYAGEYHVLRQPSSSFAHGVSHQAPPRPLAVGELHSEYVHSGGSLDEPSLRHLLGVPLGRNYWHMHPFLYAICLFWFAFVFTFTLILLFYSRWVSLLILLVFVFLPCCGNVAHDLSQRNSLTRDYWRRNDKDYQRRKIEFANWLALPPERLEDAIRLFRVTHNYVSFEAALAHFHLSEQDYIQLTRNRGLGEREFEGM